MNRLRALLNLLGGNLVKITRIHDLNEEDIIHMILNTLMIIFAVMIVWAMWPGN